jgi:hypothetical protein
MPARVFVGYGYNARDQWIEDQVFPILKALGLEILQARTCTAMFCRRA